jgi:TRAP-type C4-dicarboxylate transport system permease small subunit
MNAVGTIGVIGLMILINSDIAGRAFFNSPITGVPEMVTYSIVGIVFLQLAHALKSGSLTRSDLLLDLLQTGAPRARRFLLALFNGLGALMMAIALVRFLPSLEKAYFDPARNFMGNPGFFTISNWPLYALIALGLLTTAIQFAANTLQSLFGSETAATFADEEDAKL